MITDAMICVIQIFNSDGEKSIELAHTKSEEIIITQYDDHKINLSYDEAKAVHAALGLMTRQPDLN
jgi:hypothetical protein